MTGLSERPSRPPREKRKADQARRAGRDGFTFSQERTTILLLYAAKIAAAQLYAPKNELAAILAALRAEQQAALRASREVEQAKAKTRRQDRFAWLFATRVITPTTKTAKPRRPFVFGNRQRKRDRRHG
jgi:hypothetical protein